MKQKANLSFTTYDGVEYDIAWGELGGGESADYFVAVSVNGREPIVFKYFGIGYCLESWQRMVKYYVDDPGAPPTEVILPDGMRV